MFLRALIQYTTYYSIVTRRTNPTKIRGEHQKTYFLQVIVDSSEGGGNTFVNCWIHIK